MPKTSSLSSALAAIANSKQIAPPKQRPDENQNYRPSREGKCTIAGHFDPEVSAALKEIGLKRRHERNGKALTVQELLEEAINDLFEKHKMSRIA